MSDLSTLSPVGEFGNIPYDLLNKLPCAVIKINQYLDIEFFNKKARSLLCRASDFSQGELGNIIKHVMDGFKCESFELGFEDATYQFSTSFDETEMAVWLTVADVSATSDQLNEARRSKAFFEDILNHIPADIAAFSPDYKFLYVNPNGVKDDALRKWLIGKTEYDYCHYRKKPIAQADLRSRMFREMIQGDTLPEWIETYKTGKRTKHILRRFHPVHKENGEIHYVLGYSIDITNRVEMEEKYLEAARYTKENPNAVLCMDLKGRLRFGNRVGRKFYRDWLKQVGNIPQRLIDDLQSSNKLSRRFAIDKTIDRRSYSIEVIPDMHTAHLNIYATDITLQKEAKATIFRKDQLLEGIANASKELLVNSDLDTAINKALSILGEKASVDRVYIFENHTDREGNLRMSQKYEWNRDGIKAQIQNPDLQNLSYDAFPGIYSVLSDNKIFSGLAKDFDDVLRETLDAQDIISILIIPIFIDDTFWGFIGFDDCREERLWTRNDEALLTAIGASIGEAIAKNKIELEQISLLHKLKNQTKQLQESNEELEQFAYVASHDLKQPLRTITSFAQLIEMKYKDQLDDKANRYIDFIVNATTRMHNLINDLLDYSKISRNALNFQVVDLNRVLQEVAENLNASIRENDATINCNDLPSIACDRQQLVQLLQNLIDNAIKFKSDQNPVIRIDVEQRENDHLFAVADNGIGMRMEYGEKIFQVFQQLEGSEKASGTGVGLSICKKIIERHKGQIWIDSIPGKGTTFYFTISKHLVVNSPPVPIQSVK